jgi:hypothetical protein
MTIDEQFLSQTIRQKSLNVSGSGPRENKCRTMFNPRGSKWYMYQPNDQLLSYIWNVVLMNARNYVINNILQSRT